MTPLLKYAALLVLLWHISIINHHHNGEAERAITTTTILTAQTMFLLHIAAIHWPNVAHAHQIWPLTVLHTAYLVNHIALSVKLDAK